MDEPSRRDAGALPVADFGRNRKLLLVLALCYTAFAIYGSLVPLHFQPLPLPEAWERFQQIPYLNLGIGSRADWVANILLFVPLAFLWLGTLWPYYGRMAQGLVSVFVLLFCASLSLALEFTQIFFPPRTVSLNDILAEFLGAGIGVVLWWTTGPRISAWLAGWSKVHTRSSATRRVLHVYLFLLFGYNLLPLDLTISVVELYHKWQEGKILLTPFSDVYEDRAQQAYALLADIGIWIPAAFLWKLSSPRPGRTVFLYVLACAIVLEFLQLFVYSRVSSTGDVLTAAVGAGLGVFLAARVRPSVDQRSVAPSTGLGGGAVVLWLLALAAWTGVLMAVFWYPFDFNTEWGFVHGRLAALKRAPFETYYYGTEFRAVTELFHKTGFFFPLGGLLAVASVALRRRLRAPTALLHAAGTLIIAGAAAVIEGGQLFLPTKYADPTDWMLETAGGLAGYFCIWILTPAWRRGDRRRTAY